MSPAALPRACMVAGCPERAGAGSGRCEAHRTVFDHEVAVRRGKTADRGLDTKHWRAFRERFAAMLIRAGVAPVCGASLPEGPSVITKCRAAAVTNARRLELHHEPPLSPDERQDWRAVCDARRVVWACHDCHAALGAQARVR